MKKIFNLFDLTQKVNYKNEVLSGITVALALVPEAIAFAIIAGLSPLTGLYAAFSIGLITSILGGRPGMISGATGAIAVIYVGMIAVLRETIPGISIEQITEYVFATVILAGMIQIIIGLLRLGKFIRLVPHPVMFGFVNGLAIVIFMAQFDSFKIDGEWISGSSMLLMLGLVALTMLIIWGLPKLTKAVPSSLVAIIVVSAITIFGGIETKTVVDTLVGEVKTLSGGFPPFHPPSISLTWANFILIFPYALIVAGVGLIESLLTLNLIDEITQTRGRSNKECVAQGTANIVTGFFSGMGGCAMIGQSIINIKGGGRGRLSGITAAVMLLVFILFASSYIEQVPIAALVGVMFMVVIGTFAWSSFRILNKIPIADAIVLIAVSAITVWQDLAIAVIAGVIISALVFAWKNATMIRARKSVKEDGTKVYEIWGPLFFGSSQTFTSKFDAKNDPQKIEIDFMESKVSDHSGIEVIKNVAKKYLDLGKEVKLTHLSPDCKALMLKANPKFEKVIETSIDDPRYHVVTDMMDSEV